MVIVREGIVRIRDIVNDDIYTLQMGTGTTAPTFSDTDIESGISASLTTPTKTVSNLTLNQEYIYSTVELNGSSISEAVIKLSDGSVLNRYVFTPFTKTSDIQFTIKTGSIIKN